MKVIYAYLTGLIKSWIMYILIEILIEMKSLSLLTLTLIISVKILAQTNLSAADTRITYFNKIEKYRKMKKIGTFLTVTGSLLSTIGIATLANSSYNIYYFEGDGSLKIKKSGHPVTGFLIAVVGHASLGTGIPLLTIGSGKKKKYQRKLDELTVSFNANPKASGLTLALHF